MPKYQIGDLMWLEGCHLRTNQPAAKLAPRRHGPFKVIQVMSAVNYRLKLPTQWSIHPVFHMDLLTPYRETVTHGPNYECLPLDLVNGEEEYEVKKILDSQQLSRRHQLQYLVKWKGYPDSNNQWVNKEDVFAEEAIREFERTNSAIAQHKRRRRRLRKDIPSSSSKYSSISLLPHMSTYYASSLKRIFAAELEEGLITPEQARAICVARAQGGPITEDERVALVGRFPDPTEEAVPSCALSPAMYNLQDPDTRILYTGQPISRAEVNRLLNALPSSLNTGQPLPVPPRIQVTTGEGDTTGMDIMEGRTVHQGSSNQEGEVESEDATCAGD